MDKTSKRFKVDSPKKLRSICGVYDQNLKLIEDSLGVNIYIKKEYLIIEGQPSAVSKAIEVLNVIVEESSKNREVSAGDIKKLLRFTYSDHSLNQKLRQFKIEVYSRKKFIFPKTLGQLEYVEAIRDYDLVFALGPAGTGKTYLAMAMAVSYLLKGNVSRIILTRPAKEAGESLGFLPGDMQDKLGPYLRPLYDALYEMMEPERIEEYLETGVIEVAPLAYMRGRTLNSAFIILDEAQNCTSEQMMMFLTRMGFDSKVVITADPTQSDLPTNKPSGLSEAIEVLRQVESIKFVNLTRQDVVRHPLVQQIIEAYGKRNRV